MAIHFYQCAKCRTVVEYDHDIFREKYRPPKKCKHCKGKMEFRGGKATGGIRTADGYKG